MLAGVPVARAPRVLIHTAVEGVLEGGVYVAHREGLIVPGCEPYLFEPGVYLPSAPALVSRFLKHLFHDCRAVWVHGHFTLVIAAFVVQVPDGGDSGEETHLSSGPKPALHVDTLVVVLELRLAPEDHEEELLVRVIRELLVEGAYLPEYTGVHEVYDLPKVSGVSGDTVRGPGEEAVVLVRDDVVDDFVEDGPLAGLLGRVALPLHLYDLETIPGCQGGHLLDLAIYRQSLHLVLLRALTGVQAVPDGFRRGFGWFLGQRPL